jgi:hypothetical protein
VFDFEINYQGVTSICFGAFWAFEKMESG